MNDVFKNRYVLGEGYPWMMGVGENKKLSLSETPIGLRTVFLDFPLELWSPDLPKYRLVLEKIEDKG